MTKEAVVKWIVVAVLVTLVALGGAFVNRDVYTKAEVNTRIEHVQEIEQTHYEQLKEQNVKIERKVDRLVDHLIEEGSDDN